MAASTCLHRRLLSAIVREPSPLPGTYRSSRAWIRTITTSTRRCQAQPSVSFGTENDEMIAQYMRNQPSQKPPRRIKQGKSQKRAASAGPRQGLVPEDDYEISDFVDRSTPQRVPEPVPQAKHEQTVTTRTERTQEEAKKAARKQERGTKESWSIQREALKQKFPEGWNPRKKLSPDAMEGIKNLHEQDPERYSTAVLAEQFKISPEAIRRILKSKWMLKQSPEKMQERRERWAKRHDKIWDQQAELGLRPQRKKDTDIEDPEKFERDLHRHEILGSI